MISALHSVLGNIASFGRAIARKPPRSRRLLPILAVLGNVVLALMLAPTVYAEDARPILGMGSFAYYGGAVGASYLLVIDYPDIACHIEGMHGPRVIVDRGTSQRCWEVSIQEHNRQMNYRRSHLLMDEALGIMAVQFGKRFKADAQ